VKHVEGIGNCCVPIRPLSILSCVDWLAGFYDNVHTRDEALALRSNQLEWAQVPGQRGLFAIIWLGDGVVDSLVATRELKSTAVAGRVAVDGDDSGDGHSDSSLIDELCADDRFDLFEGMHGDEDIRRIAEVAMEREAQTIAKGCAAVAKARPTQSCWHLCHPLLCWFGSGSGPRSM
jgi:hypothetical protein